MSAPVLDIAPHPVLPRPAQLGVGALVLGFAGPEEAAVLRAVNDRARAARSAVGLRGQRFFAQYPAVGAACHPASPRGERELSA
ncbi:hypothetical protein [Phaeacidiphilus oryzae]|uniref:hypothetical protein n=1 Tax=Phaeacidiphilus oryzae TaxID=348818 RepID=UPI0005691454|nr:hypothetical protein [Phaeacidiphilus oryzae]